MSVILQNTTLLRFQVIQWWKSTPSCVFPVLEKNKRHWGQGRNCKVDVVIPLKQLVLELTCTCKVFEEKWCAFSLRMTIINLLIVFSWTFTLSQGPFGIYSIKKKTQKNVAIAFPGEDFVFDFLGSLHFYVQVLNCSFSHLQSGKKRDKR